MKRYGNIYSRICDRENIRNAHHNARKDKSFYKEVQRVNSNEDYYIDQIYEMLKNKTYKVSKYKISKICDKGKTRELMKLPYFPDRIIQWAIMLQIEEYFMKTFCFHVCASLPDRGIRHAHQLMSKYLKNTENTQFCFKCDVKKFYPSINRSILKQKLHDFFKDKKLLELLDLIIDSPPGETGIPIGSYLSQFLANFYLSDMDHWLKEEMHQKYVIRYMDDIVILLKTKEEAHKLKNDIETYLIQHDGLQMKNNWQVFPVDKRGISFIGFRYFHDYSLLRQTTCKRFKKLISRINHRRKKQLPLAYTQWCALNSYRGWLEQCNSHRLYEKYMKPVEYMDEEYRQLHHLKPRWKQ